MKPNNRQFSLIFSAIASFLFVMFATSHAFAFSVVTTLPSLAAITEAVVGSNATVETLSRPNEDPHRVDPTPDKIVLLNQADLLITVGLELEDAWLEPVVKESRNSSLSKVGDKRLITSQFVKLIDVATHKVSRAQGDVHAGGNPHFYFDPRAAAKIAVAIEKKMSQLDPEHRAEYKKNTRHFLTSLREVMTQNITRFKALSPEKRVLVTYHKSLDYLVDWLGLKVVGTVEVKPGIAPTPAHIAELLQVMKENDVKLILQEKFYPKSSSEKIEKLVEGKLVTIDGGVNFPKQGYVGYLRAVTDSIYSGLQ